MVQDLPNLAAISPLKYHAEIPEIPETCAPETALEGLRLVFISFDLWSCSTPGGKVILSAQSLKMVLSQGVGYSEKARFVFMNKIVPVTGECYAVSSLKYWT